MTRVLICAADGSHIRYYIRKDNFGFGGIEFWNPKRKVGLDIGANWSGRWGASLWMQTKLVIKAFEYFPLFSWLRRTAKIVYRVNIDFLVILIDKVTLLFSKF